MHTDQYVTIGLPTFAFYVRFPTSAPRQFKGCFGFNLDCPHQGALWPQRNVIPPRPLTNQFVVDTHMRAHDEFSSVRDLRLLAQCFELPSVEAPSHAGESLSFRCSPVCVEMSILEEEIACRIDGRIISNLLKRSSREISSIFCLL